MKTAQYAIGLEFNRKRFPKAKEMTSYRLDDIYTTSNSAGEVVKIEYIISHEFMGQRIKENVCAVTIARALWDSK